MDDLQTMGPEGTAGFGHLNNGIGQAGNDLPLGSPPGKLHLHRNALFGKISTGKIDQFGGDLLPPQIFYLFDLGITGYRQDPKGRATADLGIQKIRDDFYLGVIFQGPILPGYTGINSATFHIAGHFLCPANRTPDLRIIDFRKIIPTVDVDLPARLSKKINSRLLQAPFGNAQL